MTIEQVIKKAIEGGYDWESKYQPMATGKDNINRTILNPLFWQALGKGMGWEENTAECFCELDAIYLTCKKWIHKWMGLIHHINDGGTIESYFQSI